MLGLTIKDKIRNENRRARKKVEDIVWKAEKLKDSGQGMQSEWTSTNGPGKQQNGHRGTEGEREVDQSVDGEIISSKRWEATGCKWHKIVKSGSTYMWRLSYSSGGTD